MKKILILSIAFFVLAAVPLTLMAADPQAQPEAENMPAGQVDMEAAKVTFEDICSKCHAPGRALGKKKDQAGWEATVTRMSSYHERQKGGAISAQDQEAIVQYLLSVAGK